MASTDTAGWPRRSLTDPAPTFPDGSCSRRASHHSASRAARQPAASAPLWLWWVPPRRHDIAPRQIPTNNFHPHFAHEKESRNLAIQVALLNRRMVAQKSRFVVCGDDRRPLDVICPDVFEKIELPPSTFHDARRFLRLAGIDAFTLFPDHEGLGLKRREALMQYKALLAKYQPAGGKPSKPSSS